MAKHKRTCLVCGRIYDYYDAAPKFFCSVGCEADSGAIHEENPVHKIFGEARAARVARNIKKADRLLDTVKGSPSEE